MEMCQYPPPKWLSAVASEVYTAGALSFVELLFHWLYELVVRYFEVL